MSNRKVAKVIAEMLKAVYVDNAEAFDRIHAKIRSTCEEVGVPPCTKEEIVGQLIADQLTQECRKEHA